MGYAFELETWIRILTLSLSSCVTLASCLTSLGFGWATCKERIILPYKIGELKEVIKCKMSLTVPKNSGSAVNGNYYRQMLQAVATSHFLPFCHSLFETCSSSYSFSPSFSPLLLPYMALPRCRKTLLPALHVAKTQSRLTARGGSAARWRRWRRSRRRWRSS